MSRKTQHKLQLALEVIKKVNLCVVRDEARNLVANRLKERNKPVILSFINAHACNICCKDIEFSNVLLKSDIIFRDGIGMQVLYQNLGIDPGVDLNGTDLIPELLNRFRQKKLALLGTQQPYLQLANENLLLNGHNTVLTVDGFQQLEHYIELVKAEKPEIIVLGMGMPKQENLSLLLRDNLDYSCLIINGGAIIDFLGNKIYRAPMWLRKVKLEWLFRLAQEPRRLFSRYIIGNFIFLIRIKSLKKILLQNALYKGSERPHSISSGSFQ